MCTARLFLSFLSVHRCINIFIPYVKHTHTHARTFRLFTSVSMPMINELMAMNNIKILANASDTWEWFFASYFCIAHTLHCLVTEWLFWYEQHTRACGATATTLALMPEQISVPFVKARRTKEQAAVLFVRNPCFFVLAWWRKTQDFKTLWNLCQTAN